jgi:hypothetical protein
MIFAYRLLYYLNPYTITIIIFTRYINMVIRFDSCFAGSLWCEIKDQCYRI